MKTTNYQCSICNKTKSFVQNNKGLDFVGLCSLTQNCKGMLLKTNNPQSTPSLVNWKARSLYYKHEQKNSSNRWIINHNLGIQPQIQIDMLVGQQYISITPKTITYQDSNTVIVTLEDSTIGIAQCTNITGTTQEPPLKRSEELQQLTTHYDVRTNNVVIPDTNLEKEFNNISAEGFITIATQDPDFWGYVDLRLTVSDNTQSSYHVLKLDDVPSIVTSWGDADKIYVNNKTYEVRSLSTSMFGEFVIPQYGSFVFDLIGHSAIALDTPTLNLLQPGQVLILLSTSPYDFADKVLDKVIDLYDVLYDTDKKTVTYNNNLLIHKSLTRSYFPDIKVL